MDKTRLPVAATLALTGVGLCWVATGAHNPLDHDSRTFSTALAAYPDGWANGVFLAGALVALVCAVTLARGAPLWVSGVGIAALLVLMDSSTLTVVGYLPAILVGSVLGLQEVNLSVLLSWGLALQVTVLLTVAAFGAVIAGRIRANLRADANAVATKRTRRWTKIAVEAPLAYALSRILMFFCVPGFDMFEFNSPILWAGLGLAVSASLGAWLTIGLIRPWGEVFPRWLPGLRGRRVPIGMAVIPGLLAAIMVATAAKDIFQSLGEGSIGFANVVDWPLMMLPQLLWPLWAVALAMATANYGIRRLTEVVARSGVEPESQEI